MLSLDLTDKEYEVIKDFFPLKLQISLVALAKQTDQ